MCRYMKHVPGRIRTFRACIYVEKAFRAPGDGSTRGQFVDAEMEEESTCEIIEERGRKTEREREREQK